ncbi:MAG: hypothetical protein ACK2T0_10705 [Anaerolineales bacterium]
MSTTIARLQPETTALRSVTVRRISRDSVYQVVAINVKWLGAFILAFVAWVMWPENGYAWWQFRLLSVLTALAALLATVDALKATGQYLQRRRLIDDTTRIGGQPKGSRLADRDDLDQAGMR